MKRYSDDSNDYGKVFVPHPPAFFDVQEVPEVDTLFQTKAPNMSGNIVALTNRISFGKKLQGGLLPTRQQFGGIDLKKIQNIKH